MIKVETLEDAADVLEKVFEQDNSENLARWKKGLNQSESLEAYDDTCREIQALASQAESVFVFLKNYLSERGELTKSRLRAIILRAQDPDSQTADAVKRLGLSACETSVRLRLLSRDLEIMARQLIDGIRFSETYNLCDSEYYQYFRKVMSEERVKSLVPLYKNSRAPFFAMDAFSFEKFREEFPKMIRVLYSGGYLEIDPLNDREKDVDFGNRVYPF